MFRNTLRNITRNSITYRADDGLLDTGDASYQHDADGFLLTKTVGTDVTAYDYSSRGELLSVILHQGTAQQKLIEYVHDPLGRRIAKTVNNVIVEKYLWQGMTRLLAVYDGNNALIMRFEYADARMPFAMTAGGATYFLAYDQVGSLRVVADGSGNPVKRIDYDSFGNVFCDSAPDFAVPFGFAGGLYDKDTKLVRFGYRDYDPDTGRWTAKDPIGFAGGDSDLYGYCVGDPVNFADSLGLSEDADTIAKAVQVSLKAMGLPQDTGNIYPLYDDFAGVKDPKFIGGWRPAKSIHGKACESGKIPGVTPELHLKYYDDPERGKIIAPVTPTDIALLSDPWK